ncbi:MAG: organomercurial lyase [Longimicrobiales bacterium]
MNTNKPEPSSSGLAHDVRLYVLRESARTARVPQPAQIASALGRDESEIKRALRELADTKVLILAPNSDNIWAASPFCAVPSGFRVESGDKTYWGICIWDALGVAAALGTDAVISASCGDCGAPMRYTIQGDALVESDGLVHFAVPAWQWWDNIGFT